METLDDIQPQPYKSQGVVLIDNQLVPVYCRTFEFSKKAARDHFVSTHEKECISVYKWSSIRGKKGYKFEVHFASMYTHRD
jgi:hypothetical protein